MWVIIIHGCNKELPKIIDIIESKNDPNEWIKKYDGKEIEDCHFYYTLDTEYQTYELDKKYSKKFNMSHTSCGLYITFVEKNEYSVNEIMDNFMVL